jgi:hypothetical protein
MTGGERLGRTKSCKYGCYNRERLRGGYIESISLDIREADRRRGGIACSSRSLQLLCSWLGDVPNSFMAVYCSFPLFLHGNRNRLIYYYSWCINGLMYFNSDECMDKHSWRLISPLNILLFQNTENTFKTHFHYYKNDLSQRPPFF